MTEPVAYLNKYIDNSTNITRHKPIEKYSMLSANNRVSSTPLYTSEQLHPRLKMTQAEFDEFHDLFEKDFDLYSAITEISDTNWRTALYDRLFTGTQKDKDKQNEFAVLWASYNPLEPEETIEIVPNMKWFVRSKKRDDEGDYAFLSGSDLDDLEYFEFDYARPFDTKEEAELWTNPLTEAVHLPAEGE
ncbi:hypothetical protein [Leuconostoc citreum]|uniref:hypothetical protein n=1 Tax=Leuconostoc citreum TaxID=33964 RepID=UPI0021A7BE47|nr:hypothetical protein [Leuconostoc citreum]